MSKETSTNIEQQESVGLDMFGKIRKFSIDLFRSLKIERCELQTLLLTIVLLMDHLSIDAFVRSRGRSLNKSANGVVEYVTCNALKLARNRKNCKKKLPWERKTAVCK